MRVLLWMIDGDSIPGGHRVQLDQTSRHLADIGVECNISFEKSPDLKNYDLIHGFGLNAVEVRQCRVRGIPVALSTIYWNNSYFIREPDDRFQKLKSRVRIGAILARDSMKGEYFDKCRSLVIRLLGTRVVYEMADMLLPNSQSEADYICSDLEVTTPYHVVPNSVDNNKFNCDGVEEKTRNGILQVGRFEPHKNQLGLIEAMKNSPVPVTLIGYPHPDHPDYYQTCKNRASKNIKILPGVPHEELVSIYRGAKVHVLPSWFETTGLVSLEAALCGCKVVTTSRGYARDYFQDMAWYCDPAVKNSIRSAVEDALVAPYPARLRERILNNFTWEHTAVATHEAYQQVLNNRGK